MPLSKLPGEILLNIGSRLGDEATSRLIRTSHFFHDFFKDEIYKMHVKRTKGIALLWAANRGDEPLTRKLLEHGADPNIGWGPRVPGQGSGVCDGRRTHQTPLMFAAVQGYLDIVQLLLAHGADPGRHNRERQTACLATIHTLIQHAHHGRLFHCEWDRLDDFCQPRKPLDPTLLATVDHLIHQDEAMYGTHGYRVLNLALQWPDQDLAVYMLRDAKLQTEFCKQPGSHFENLLRTAALYHRVVFVQHLLDVAYNHFPLEEWHRLSLVARDATRHYFRNARRDYFLMYNFHPIGAV